MSPARDDGIAMTAKSPKRANKKQRAYPARDTDTILYHGLKHSLTGLHRRGSDGPALLRLCHYLINQLTPGYDGQARADELLLPKKIKNLLD